MFIYVIKINKMTIEPVNLWRAVEEQNWLFAVGFVTIIFTLGQICYNLWFHPLSSYPGPLLARATYLWYVRSMLRGTMPFDVLDLHKKYGDTVRITPTELVYNHPDAWKDIYGYRSGKSEIPKDREFYRHTSGGLSSILSARGARHGELRRLLSHGFSEKSLREQEVTVQKYADMFINQLRSCCYQAASDDQGVTNMVKWYNFFTFDVIGDLAYGESFDCLASGNYHPWIANIFNNVKFASYYKSLSLYPSIQWLFDYFVPASVKKGRKEHRRLSREKAMRRLENQEEKSDLVSKMTSPKSGVSIEEFAATTAVLILAGSETTATLLSGVTHMLVTNREKLNKLVHEVRTAFSSENEITFTSVNTLKYMLACLDEAARMYPPVPASLPRRTEQPEKVLGKYVPSNTTISVHHWAMYHSEQNFTRPDEFVPERWLNDPQFAHDRKYALQPFHVGPRNCIGRNLAYVEMRLILARLLFNFDIEGTTESTDWDKQQVFLLWNKGPLMVKLRPVQPGVV